MNVEEAFLNSRNKELAREVFLRAIDTGLDFKLQDDVRQGDTSKLEYEDFLDDIPEHGLSIEEVQEEFRKRFLPYCYNFASTKFMGFPDAGNSIAAIAGSLTADFLQQNLINQSFCSPSGTYAEISVIRWLREVVGYKNPDRVSDVFDVGGIITGGGTMSNTVAVMLARENYVPDTMRNGIKDTDGYYLVIPKGIGHYSVKSAQMWIGCGNRLLEVETDNFKYNLNALEATLKKYKGKIMGLVAYAGDSRTMTVDQFESIAKLTRSIDPSIWLHADACHGFSLGFSDLLRVKLKGIELFDSVTTDPHKVMNSPYTISSLLVRNPQKLRTISSTSDLIMQEQFALGQITPFIGSKPWMSLKLWFAMKNIGRKGFGEIIEKRHKLALNLAELINNSKYFVLINKVDINSVAFMYKGANSEIAVSAINDINRKIHSIIIKEGRYHLHQFSIPDAGVVSKGDIIYPLRFMSGNPNTTKDDLEEMLQYIINIAKNIKGAS